MESQANPNAAQKHQKGQPDSQKLSNLDLGESLAWSSTGGTDKVARAKRKVEAVLGKLASDLRRHQLEETSAGQGSLDQAVRAARAHEEEVVGLQQTQQRESEMKSILAQEKDQVKQIKQAKVLLRLPSRH